MDYSISGLELKQQGTGLAKQTVEGLHHWFYRELKNDDKCKKEGERKEKEKETLLVEWYLQWKKMGESLTLIRSCRIPKKFQEEGADWKQSYKMKGTTELSTRFTSQNDKQSTKALKCSCYRFRPPAMVAENKWGMDEAHRSEVPSDITKGYIFKTKSKGNGNFLEKVFLAW